MNPHLATATDQQSLPAVALWVRGDLAGAEGALREAEELLVQAASLPSTAKTEQTMSILTRQRQLCAERVSLLRRFLAVVEAAIAHR